MALVNVTPTKGRVIRDEQSAIRLPNDKPTPVEFSIYWHRLAERGDVTIEFVSDETPAKAAKSSKRDSAKSEE